MWNDSVKKEAGKYLIGAGVISFMLGLQVYAQKTSTVVSDFANHAASIMPTAGNESAAANPQFSERKKELLKSIGEHIAKMQKKQSCISAAADEKALDACRGRKDSPAAVK